jgi:hypothetical protein
MTRAANPTIIPGPRRWTESMNALLREVYPTPTPVRDIAVAMGFPPDGKAIIAQAARLGLSRPPLPSYKDSAAAQQLLTAAKSEHGATYAHCTATSLATAYGLARRLMLDGLLFRAQTGHKEARFFDTPERAAAAAKQRPRPLHPTANQRPPQPRGKKNITYSIARHCGPAHLPGEPVITSRTKVTIAPPPPARLLRTNTHTPG